MAISFYLREFGTSSFVKREKQFFDEKFIPIKTDALLQSMTTFCPIHKKWEDVVSINVVDIDENSTADYTIKISCGEVLQGFPYEIPKVPSEQKEKIEKCKEELSELEFGAIGERKIKTQILSDYLTQTIRLENLQIENNNFYDEKKVKKDILGFQLFTEEKHNSITLEYFMLDRKIVDSNMFNPKIAPPIKKYSIVTRLGNSKDYYMDCDIKIASEEEKEKEKKELDWRWNWIEYPRYKEIVFNVSLPESAMEQIHSVLNSYAGRYITFNTVLTGEDLFNGIYFYPYEPNCYKIHKFDSNLTSILQDTKSPNIYNKIVELLKIKNYPTLRKLFYSEPLVLVIFSRLSESGFKDINIINSILGDENAQKMLEFSKNPLEKFMNFLLSGHSERAACNIVRKTLNDDKLGKTEKEDGFDMFYKYFNYLDDETKKSIMKDGMTLYNHDLLSKLSSDLINKNIEFVYTENQLSLEDEIDGYKFELARNSDMLRELGSKLHNCVASYKDRVLKGQCIIVFAKKEGTLKLCIEVRENIVWQQRADRNTTPQGEDAEVLKKWEKKHNLFFAKNSY